MLKLHWKKILLILSLSLVGCMPSQESEVSMIALIANATKYEDRKVKTYGFLKVRKNAGLFVNREDALNDNTYHSIALDALTTTELAAIKVCNNQYVSITGTINLKNNTLTFAEEVQIKGKPENIYSKLVCNIKTT